jgi:CrcB protein
MTALPAVAAAGAAGAVARFVLDRYVGSRYRGPFPLATLLINTSGALALGLLTGAVLYHGLAHVPEAIAGTGFCGGYTTFSTFSVENVRLVQSGRLTGALLYTTSSLGLGLAAAAAGIVAMQL